LSRDKSKRPGARPGSSPGQIKAPERPPFKIVPERAKHIGLRPAVDSGKQHYSSAAKPPVFRRAGTSVIIYGFHAVREALRARRRTLLDIYATEPAATILADDIACAQLPLHIVESEVITNRLGSGAMHQGVMLEASPLASLDITDIESRSGIMLVLDQITDPHNVGAILRTAAAFGIDGVAVARRHAPDMTGVVAKVASGGLEHVAVISVTNLARTLDRLGESGYLRLGLDSEAKLSLAKAPLWRPMALVLGGEGKGLRRLSREKCDFLVRLDMPGRIKSLNVSNACAVALTLLHAHFDNAI
jgi:23S rRNA (guanosine2251-2'-O)-methyltransferase